MKTQKIIRKINQKIHQELTDIINTTTKIQNINITKQKNTYTGTITANTNTTKYNGTFTATTQYEPLTKYTTGILIETINLEIKLTEEKP